MTNIGTLRLSLRRSFGRGSLRLLIIPAALVCLSVAAQAQSFNLQMDPFTTDAVNPGGSDSATLAITGTTGPVTLSCQISPVPPNGNAGCTVSPLAVTPPGGASVTIVTNYTSGTTTEQWPAADYTVTITGTAGTETATASQSFSVLQVPLSFNVTVQTPIAPASVPAGGSSQGVISVNPVNGYSGQITLSCSSITPVSVSPPVCSFNPPTVSVNTAVVTSVLTITTTGPLNIVKLENQRRTLYATWLSFPMLGLVGIIVLAGKPKRKIPGLLAIVSLAGLLLLVPACSHAPLIIQGQNNTVTPNNTYTFTITGVDANGTAASAGANNAVKLTVTSATT